jgi:hypothetical protein
LNELSQVSVQNVVESADDPLQLTGFVSLVAGLKEVVVVLAELILDLSDEEVTPLNKHVLGHSLMMGVLDLLQIFQFSWELKHLLVGVEVSLLLEIDALLNKNAGHGHKVIVRREVLALNAVVVRAKVILWTSNDSKVRGGLLSHADWNLHPGKFVNV